MMRCEDKAASMVAMRSKHSDAANCWDVKKDALKVESCAMMKVGCHCRRARSGEIILEL